MYCNLSETETISVTEKEPESEHMAFVTIGVDGDGPRWVLMQTCLHILCKLCDLTPPKNYNYFSGIYRQCALNRGA